MIKNEQSQTHSGPNLVLPLPRCVSGHMYKDVHHSTTVCNSNELGKNSMSNNRKTDKQNVA